MTCRAGLVHLTLPSFATIWPAVVVASAHLVYLLAGTAGLQPTGSRDGRWPRRRAAAGRVILVGMNLRRPVAASQTSGGRADRGTIIAGLGQGVAFTTMYLAAGTGVAADEQGIAAAVASTAQQLGGSVGLAGLVVLLSARAVALGGTGAGPTAQSPAILTGALHATFATQAAIALLGAAIALLVIGRGAHPQDRRPERDDRCQDPLTQTAA